MTGKKQELIELVALKALQVSEAQCGVAESRITKSLDEIGMQEKAERIEQAKAIIDLLDVEVAGDDSGPKDEDIVLSYRDKAFCSWVGRVDEKGNYGSEQMLTTISELKDRSNKYKIIQRNNKPVINIDNIKGRLDG